MKTPKKKNSVGYIFGKILFGFYPNCKVSSLRIPDIYFGRLGKGGKKVRITIKELI